MNNQYAPLRMGGSGNALTIYDKDGHWFAQGCNNEANEFIVRSCNRLAQDEAIKEAGAGNLEKAALEAKEAINRLYAMAVDGPVKEPKGIRLGGDDGFWLVTNAKSGYVIEDCCVRFTLRDLGYWFMGIMEVNSLTTSNPTIFTDEGEAKAEAIKRLEAVGIKS